MKIEKITIQNFRSYYGENLIEFNDGLTLVIGDNGDGKTTFFEVLEWLFDTRDAENKADNRNYPNFISAKRLSELSDDEKDVVRVEMLFDHDGKKLVEKQFIFSKDGDKVNIIDFHFKGYENIGSEREEIKGNKLLERCFDTAIRKYCLFKGESELNIFNNQEAMNLLLKYFSDIKDFDTYLKFTEYAEAESKKQAEKILKKDATNEKKINSLNDEIDEQNKSLAKIQTELNNNETETRKYTGFISNIEKNANISSALNDLNNRLDSLREKQKNLNDTVNENYTIRLLDDKWILCGFSEIFKDYQNKIYSVSKEKRRIEDEVKRQEGIVEGKQEVIDEFINTFAEGIIPLSVNVPDEYTMRDMINDEICKVCGREAKKGTEAYNFMVNKLNEFIKSQEPNQEPQEQSIFLNNFIRELEDFGRGSRDELGNLINLITENVNFNKTQKEEIEKLQNSINETVEEKIKLIAQSGNLTEQELTNQYHNITEWVSKKTDADKAIPLLKAKEEAILRKLAELQEEYYKIAKNSQGSIYVKIHTALEKINNAFNSAKNKNTDDFFKLLEEKSNQYLAKLNVEDFHGIIKLEQKILSNNEKTAKIVLRENHGNIIHNPNTALKTTVYMSVLFGIAEITNREREEDYPLIFDAPTSSFSDAKESDFFNVISGIKKQCIIFTKSFLIKTGSSGRNLLDINQIKSLNCTVYRIEKERPFDEKDLSTIRTTIEFIQ